MHAAASDCSPGSGTSGAAPAAGSAPAAGPGEAGPPSPAGPGAGDEWGSHGGAACGDESAGPSGGFAFRAPR